jgi:hypothetical protein
MLAALQQDRFLLFKEADLVALGIPYELRRSTQDKVLKHRAERPYNPLDSPRLSPSAKEYLYTVETAQSESSYSLGQLKELRHRIAAMKADHKKGFFEKPLSAAYHQLVEKADGHRKRVRSWHDACERYYFKMTWEEAQWFRDLPPVTRWAGDFPLLAPAPQCFYPLEETPERARQMHLLKWLIQTCG